MVFYVCTHLLELSLTFFVTFDVTLSVTFYVALSNSKNQNRLSFPSLQPTPRIIPSTKEEEKKTTATNGTRTSSSCPLAFSNLSVPTKQITKKAWSIYQSSNLFSRTTDSRIQI